MKLYYLMNLLVLSSFLISKAQGIRLGKVTLLTSNHQDMIKISSTKGSIQDDQLLAKSAEISSGIHRKLGTNVASFTTPTTILKNQKDGGNKYNQPEVKPAHQLVEKEETSKSSQEDSVHWKKDSTEQHVDAIDIAQMDYTPARKKSPIHN